MSFRIRTITEEQSRPPQWRESQVKNPRMERQNPKRALDCRMSRGKRCGYMGAEFPTKGLLAHRCEIFCQRDTCGKRWTRDRKSTRLNSSHMSISYAVFCLK